MGKTSCLRDDNLEEPCSALASSSPAPVLLHPAELESPRKGTLKVFKSDSSQMKLDR